LIVELVSILFEVSTFHLVHYQHAVNFANISISKLTIALLRSFDINMSFPVYWNPFGAKKMAIHVTKY